MGESLGHHHPLLAGRTRVSGRAVVGHLRSLSWRLLPRFQLRQMIVALFYASALPAGRQPPGADLLYAGQRYGLAPAGQPVPTPERQRLWLGVTRVIELTGMAVVKDHRFTHKRDQAMRL